MEWMNSGVLSKAPENTYYKLTAESNGESVSWLIGLLNLRSEPKVSVPFRIPPVFSEERARLLEAAYAYTDLVELVGRSEPSVVIQSSELLGKGERDSVQWTLEAVSGDFSELQTDNDWSVATGASTWIAAQGFSERNGSKRRVVAADHVPVAIRLSSAKGTKTNPQHTICTRLTWDPDQIKSRLAEHFSLVSTPTAQIMSEMQSKLQAREKRAFGVAVSGGIGFVAEVNDLDALLEQLSNWSSPATPSETHLLHEYVFAKLLGLTGSDYYTFAREADQAIAAVEEAKAAAFILPEMNWENMIDADSTGVKLPYNAVRTNLAPVSGMMLWSLRDFEA